MSDLFPDAEADAGVAPVHAGGRDAAVPPAPAGSGQTRTPSDAGKPTGERPSIFALAWPSITTMLLQSTVGFIDTVIVGSLGASAVTAVTNGNRIFFTMEILLIAVTGGTTALVARAWGAGDRIEAERTTRTSILTCLAIGMVLGAIGTALAGVAGFIFRLDPETTRQTEDFIRWISPFLVGFSIQFSLGAALRAAGDVITPLVVGAVSNIVNVVLVYALVYGELPIVDRYVHIPMLGVKGAAIASGTAFSLGSLAMLGLYLARRLCIRPGPRGSWTRERLWRLLRIGLPTAGEQVVFQGGFLAFLVIVALYGSEPNAAYGIGVNILSFSFVVGFGYAIAASTLVGQHLGAGEPSQAMAAGWRAMRLSVYAMIVLGIAIVAAAEPIARFVIDDDEVVRLTVVFIYILGAVQPLMAIEFSISGALRGAGDTRWPLYSGSCGFAVRLTLASLAARAGWSVEWVYAALIGDYILKATILSTRFARGRWQQVHV